MGKSIHPMEARSLSIAPPLIVWMSFRLVIPWRVALQQSPLPLRQPDLFCGKVVLRVEQFLLNGE
jgi:hypothetical protein